MIGLYLINNTIDLVILACLNFREFLILKLSTKSGIREIIIFAKFFNSHICLPCEIRENYILANITRSTVTLNFRLIM